jgi:hypothetical protein
MKKVSSKRNSKKRNQKKQQAAKGNKKITRNQKKQ